MKIKEIRKLIKSLAYDFAKKVTRRQIENTTTRAERTKIGEPTIVSLRVWHAWTIICEASEAVMNLKGNKNPERLTPKLQHIRKEMWKNYYALVNENSDLARYHDVETLLCAYLIAWAQSEHVTEFTSPKVYAVRKNVRRDAKLFARRHSPGNSVEMCKKMNDSTQYDGFSKREPDVTHVIESTSNGTPIPEETPNHFALHRHNHVVSAGYNF